MSSPPFPSNTSSVFPPTSRTRTHTHRGTPISDQFTMGEAGMRKKAQKKFRIRGFTLRVDALDAVLSYISRFPEDEEEALEILIDGIEKESREFPLVFSFSPPQFALNWKISDGDS